MKENLKCFFYDSRSKKTLERQQGIFRTNCLDCLDRTNYFQAKLALLTLESILERFSITFDQPLIEQMNDPDNHTQLITQFRNTWADNGDAVSFHYTGTGSTHTE